MEEDILYEAVRENLGGIAHIPLLKRKEQDSKESKKSPQLPIEQKENLMSPSEEACKFVLDNLEWFRKQLSEEEAYRINPCLSLRAAMSKTVSQSLKNDCDRQYSRCLFVYDLFVEILNNRDEKALLVLLEHSPEVIQKISALKKENRIEDKAVQPATPPTSEAYEFVLDNPEWFRKQFSKKNQRALLAVLQHSPEVIENSLDSNNIEDKANLPAIFSQSRKDSVSPFENKELSKDVEVEKKENKQAKEPLSAKDVDAILPIITEILTELNSIKRDYEKPFFEKTAKKKSCVDRCINLLNEIQVSLDNNLNKAIELIHNLRGLTNDLLSSQEQKSNNCLCRFFSSQRGQTKNEQNSFVKIEKNVTTLEIFLEDEAAIVKNFKYAKQHQIINIINNIRNRANQYIKNVFRYEKTKDKLIPMQKLLATAKAINKIVENKDWMSISEEDNRQLAILLSQITTLFHRV